MVPVAPTEIHVDAERITFAKDQPPYAPIHAAMDKDGLVLTEWEPTAEELALLMNGSRIRIWVFTFRKPLQPLTVEVAPKIP